MKYLNGKCYVEVQNKRDTVQPTEKIILRKKDPAFSLRTQYQVRNIIQIKKNQKLVRNDNHELIVKNNPKKKQTFQQQPMFEQPKFPNDRRDNWLEISKRRYCHNCEYIINKQEHQIDKRSSWTISSFFN